MEQVTKEEGEHIGLVVQLCAPSRLIEHIAKIGLSEEYKAKREELLKYFTDREGDSRFRLGEFAAFMADMLTGGLLSQSPDNFERFEEFFQGVLVSAILIFEKIREAYGKTPGLDALARAIETGRVKPANIH